MKIENISLADKKIESFEIDAGVLKIVSNDGYNLNNNTKLGRILITITNWQEIKGVKFVSSKPFEKPEKFILSQENYEALELIQEFIVSNSVIRLHGFSKQSGAWLEYEIIGNDNLPSVKITKL